MNEKVEEPQGQPSDHPALREISSEDLKEMLEAHRRWTESEGKEGEPADLSYARLRKADFTTKDLRGADLEGADLQASSFYEARLEDLRWSGNKVLHTNLKGARLREALLREATLCGAILEDADLYRAQLQGADLRGANLYNANLQQADLRGTKIQNVEMGKATLREADLQDANLEDAKSFLAQQLAGANVSGAKLPPDIHNFEALTTIDEASKNTKRIFLAMLLGCAYSVLTIFSTTDARLLTNSASSPLPIIQTPIPIAGFFGVAPAILLAIYLYFHFYLQRLWEGLADLPAFFPDGRPLDKRAYPWLVNGLVRSHFALLRKDRPPLSRPQALLSILLAWCAVPFTIALFWLRYLPRHDWFGTAVHIVLLVVSVGFGIMSYRLAAATLRGVTHEKKEGGRNYKPYAAALGIGIIFSIFSFGALEGVHPYSHDKRGLDPIDVRRLVPEIFLRIGYLPFADLKEVDVSIKPPNWLGTEDEIPLVRGARLRGRNLRYAEAFNAFLVNADLSGANLQGADLIQSDLTASKLHGANLQGANLREANLQKADLSLMGAPTGLATFNFPITNLHDADLTKANLQGADFTNANLEGATLDQAWVRGTNLEAQGLTPFQVKQAKDWKLAFYSDNFLKELGLPSDHNEKVKKKLAELEKAKKATGATP